MEPITPPSEYELIIQDLTVRHMWRERLTYWIVLVALLAIIVVLVLRPAPVHTIERFALVDKSTGFLHRFAQLEDLPMTDRVKHTRNHVNMYLLYREWYGMELASDMDMVRRQSSKDVWEPYFDKVYNGKESLYRKHGKNLRVTVELESLVLDNNHTATMVYKKSSKIGNQAEAVTCWTVTMTFEYLSMDGKEVPDVDMNPDGFHVTSWRPQELSRCAS